MAPRGTNRNAILRAALALPVVVGASVLPSCESCTDVGCGSGVTFHLGYDLQRDRTYVWEACVDTHCWPATLRHSGTDESVSRSDPLGRLEMVVDDDILGLTLPEDENWDGEHTVTLRMDWHEDGRRERIRFESTVEFEAFHPNGPRCEPTCWVAEVTVSEWESVEHQ